MVSVLYADPRHCPACRGALPPTRERRDPDACPHCRVPLRGPAAAALWQTLLDADRGVAALRRLAAEPTPLTGLATTAPLPRPASAAPGARLSPQRVPDLLLGLGAVCLVTGALVFLAIAWNVLGIGGRTAVIGLGALAGAGAGALAAARGLRTATAASTAVTAGLAVLTVHGAAAAGWIAGAAGAGVLLVDAVVLGIGGVLAARALQTSPAGLLATPQLLALGGALLVVPGLADAVAPLEARLAVAVALLAALAGLGGHWRLPVLTRGGAGLAVAAWVPLALLGLERAAQAPSAGRLWLDGQALGLVAAAALALAAAAVGALPHTARFLSGTAGLAGLLVAAVLGLHGAGLDAAVCGWVLALLATACSAPLLGARWRCLVLGPALAAAVVPTVVVLDTLLAGVASVLSGARDAARGTAADRLDATAALAPLPRGTLMLDLAWVAVPTALALVVAGAALAATLLGVRRAPAWATVVALALSGATPVAAAAASGACLAAVVGGLLVLAVLGALVGSGLIGDLVAAALGTRAVDAAWAVGLGWALVAVLVATPSAALTVGAAATAAAVCAVVLRGCRGAALGLPGHAALALPGALALVVHQAGALSGLPPGPAGVAAVATAALAALRLGRSGALAGALLTLGAAAALALVQPEPGWWIAVQLTVAGVAAGAGVLLHRAPGLGWLGGGLLVAASWVRLGTEQVTAPEAYTLPAAVALLGLGLLRMRERPGAGSVRALTTGLVLALVPSLPAALAEPASVRTLLLAGAALGAILAGTALRWAAPLVIGSAVGAALALRGLLPYAAALPPYVVMVAAGCALVVVGVTWESRMRGALRQGRTFVAALR